MFRNRTEAGFLLARKMDPLRGKFDLVAAIPRGGVVVGYEISKILGLPMKALVVKKVPTYGAPELAAGAVGPEGFSTGKKNVQVEKLVSERIKMYGGNADFKNKNVVLVDDGVATGATIEMAIRYLKSKAVGIVAIAVPVVSKDEYDRLEKMSDKVVALETPIEFGAIGEFYEDFSQVSDTDVIQLLQI